MKYINDIVFCIGILAFFFSVILHSNDILIITMGCYGFIYGRLTHVTKKYLIK